MTYDPENARRTLSHYTGPKVGPVLEAAALRHKDRLRRNSCKACGPLRAHWIADLMAFAALAFAALITIGKVFGL